MNPNEQTIKITSPQVDEYEDIVYSQIKESWNTRELKMSLLVPRTDNLKPAILYFPGGGFTTSNYHKFIQLRLALAKAGMVVASAQYRHIPDKFPCLIEDAKKALIYLKNNSANYHIDTNKIAVIGDSAGGYLAQLMGVTSNSTHFLPTETTAEISKVAAVVSLYGISDLSTIGGTKNPPVFHKGTSSPEALLIHGIGAQNSSLTINDSPEKAKKASPTSYVTNNLPPFLLLHGSADTLVSPEQSQHMYEALYKKNVDASYITVNGAGHGTAEWYQDSIINEIRDWLLLKLS